MSSRYEKSENGSTPSLLARQADKIKELEAANESLAATIALKTMENADLAKQIETLRKRLKR